jgi:O-antigen/teichoic acid export membrane protein
MSFKQLLYKNFIWRGLYFVTVFALNVTVARCYEAGMSGWINFISNNFALVLLLSSLSLESGVTYFGASGKIAEGRLALFSVLWTVMITGLFLFTSDWFITRSPAIVSKGLLRFASVCYVSGILLTNFFLNLFVIRKEYMLPNAVMAFFNIVLILLAPWQGNGLLGWFDKESFLYFYYAVYVLQGLLLVICYLLLYGVKGWRLPGWAELKPLFRYALIALAGNLVFFLVYRVDYWFINYYRANDVELGNYIQASKLGQTLLVLGTIIAGIVFPQTAGGMRQEVNRKIKLISRNLLVLFAIMLCGAAFTGRWLFPFVFGETFRWMFIPFLILLPGIFFLSILTILSAYFGGKNRPLVNVKGALAGLVVIVLGDWLLIPRYGINAAALVSTMGYAVSMGYSLWQFKKDYQTPLGEFFVPQRGDFQWWRQWLKK